MNVKILQIEIGGKYYPQESWDLDWENNCYVLAYDAFHDFKRNYLTDSIPNVDRKGFKCMYKRT
jgi:hypothetical protein